MNLSRRALAALVVAAATGTAPLPALPQAAPAPAPAPSSSDHFVLIHGAWHGAWCWHQVQALLEAAGQRVSVMDLASHGIDKRDPASVTLNDYTQPVVDYLDTLTEPVVLVGHSMGGIVISTVAEARPAMVERLVYLAAFLVPSGSSMLDLALQDPQSLVGRNLIPGPGTLDIDRSVIDAAFYGRSPAPAIALARATLTVNPLLPIVTPLYLTDTNYGSVPRYYVETTYDQAITPALQAQMQAALPCAGVFRLDTDHSPFFSHPLALAQVLLRAARA